MMFRVNVSPFLISATIKHHVERYREQYPAATEILVSTLTIQRACGVATFLRVKHKDRISIDLVTSKSRAAPLKRLSLPNLEMMGALLAARLPKEVKKIIDRKCPTTIFFWMDSQITIYWNKVPRHKWKPFVENKVLESLTDPNSWFNYSSKDNSTDLLTSRMSVVALTTNCQWQNGPLCKLLAGEPIPIRSKFTPLMSFLMRVTLLE
ncbi:uncharacterized protein NPIL_338231 [Nephila pilipes]|uniref:Uncharacterized protein n=1 Tax=Nephila pilipes TaxID=299642 RepID=A0A8X6PZU4_NEPPI|nr:uncharacterized protein NPIL_338231 [Nephila pilipes]